MSSKETVSREVARLVNPGTKYECSLDEKSLAKAKKELNENPDEREAAVDQLRAWILHQAHFKCCTDTRFLLMFLRRSAFSQLEARALIENYVAVCSTKLAFFSKDIDTHSKGFQAMLAIGMYNPLPVADDEGRRIIIVRPAGLQKGKGFTNVDPFKVFNALMTYLVQFDDATQVNGVVILDDQTNVTPKALAFCGLDNIVKMMTFFMNKYPIRMKAWHLYNAATVAQTLMAALVPFFPKKIQDRIFLHGNNLEDVYKTIPMRLLPIEYLPDDFNGSVQGSILKIQESYRDAFKNKAVRDRIWNITSSGMTYDESKKPVDAEPQASFRKLNIN